MSDGDPDLQNSVRNWGPSPKNFGGPHQNLGAISNISRFDREYLRKATRNRQTENSAANCDHARTLNW